MTGETLKSLSYFDFSRYPRCMQAMWKSQYMNKDIEWDDCCMILHNDGVLILIIQDHDSHIVAAIMIMDNGVSYNCHVEPWIWDTFWVSIG